ncbi:aminotransferase class I/II-fold pyridoxal phosphate-dependent enzyme [Cupriavidus sp. 8B]
MAAKARVDALRAAGREIIDFTLGEPDFPTPPHIIRAGIDALTSGHTRYTGSAGTPALRQAIAAKLLRENQLAYQPGEIVVGGGAKHIIFTAFAATLNEGDEVIVPAPFWVSYPDMVAINGGTAVIAPCDAANGFKLTAAALEGAITPRTRWLVLNTPNNPTGAVYSHDELAALCAVLRMHPHVWIMTDEIYEHFVYGEARHLSPLNVAADLMPRTLVVNGLSKAYAFTGWRVGYGAGPSHLIQAINLLLSQSTTCASAISQAAAVIALDGPQQCVREAAALFQARRDRMVALLNSIDGIQCRTPDGAFYVFPSVAGLIGRTAPDGTVLASDVDVMMYFLEQAGVATIDGTSYGFSPYLRLSFATSMAQIEAGCAALAAAVERCNPSPTHHQEHPHA